MKPTGVPVGSPPLRVKREEVGGHMTGLARVRATGPSTPRPSGSGWGTRIGPVLVRGRGSDDARGARTICSAIRKRFSLLGCRLPPPGRAALVLFAVALAGCQAPQPTPGPSAQNPAEPARLFREVGLPTQIGLVENRGPQLPAVSPDGTRIVYLRVDAETISPMTLLGSAEPGDTPVEGTLSLWIRPLEGSLPGRRLSQQRWVHSPVWAPSGKAIAFVANESPGSMIVHLDLNSGRETLLGMPGVVNCLPRFDGDDRTLLFCSGASAAGPFRVFRQELEQGAPDALSPEGEDCVWPALTSPEGRAVCAVASQEQLRWVLAGPDGTTDLSGPVGEGGRPALLSVCAGVGDPVSPDRRGFLFYNAFDNRIVVCDFTDRRLAQHRSGSIAACWIGPEICALATADNLFAVHVFSGVSLPLMSGSWIPVRFVPTTRTLIVLGKGPGPSRLAIYRITLEPATPDAATVQEKP